eukprot:scaffold142821_cov20-Tisochrysis_lutea.AAC.2
MRLQKVKAGTSKVGGSSKIGTSKIGTSKIGTSKIGSSKIKAGTTKKAAVEPESERLSIGPFTIPKLSDILARNEDNGPYTDEPSWFLVIGLLAVSFATAGYLVVTANSGYDRVTRRSGSEADTTVCALRVGACATNRPLSVHEG